MTESKTSALETEVSELKNLVHNLLDKVNKLTTENTALREEVRHLKKLKGKPNIRPGKKTSESNNAKGDNKPEQGSNSGNTPPPKSKRPGLSKAWPNRQTFLVVCSGQNLQSRRRTGWLEEQGLSGFYPC